jgi:hypothetical protein
MSDITSQNPSGVSLVSKATQVRRILARKGLNLLQVSKSSVQLFGDHTLYHVPHNLYFDLRRDAFTPNLFQLVALSAISGYCLRDWLAIFDVNLEDIVRLQIILERRRTALLDATLYDDNIVFPRGRMLESPQSPILPFTQMFTPIAQARIGDSWSTGTKRFAYAKIGFGDPFQTGEIPPGSIVRADTSKTEIQLPLMENGRSPELYLVRHSGGISCSHVYRATAGHFALGPSETSSGIKNHGELKILGAIDLEIRRFTSRLQKINPWPGFKGISNLEPYPLKGTTHHFLPERRLRNGLSFRQASLLSREIARELGDERYFAAIASLSDYEASDTAPRDIHKVISLCILYSIDFWEFLRLANVQISKLGTERVPENLSPIPRSATDSVVAPGGDPTNPLISWLVEQFDEIPFFLRKALPAVCGMSHVSLRDLFWVASGGQEFLGSLRGAAILCVNRRVKIPVPQRSRDLAPRVYLLARRDGSFFCGAFFSEKKMLVLQSLTPFPSDPPTPMQRGDAEIVGQIVTVVRRLPSMG